MAWNPFKRRPSWDGLADAKALTGTPEVLDAIRDRAWQPFPLLGGGSRQRILDAFNTAQSANYAWTYRNSPAVRTVVDVLVRNIGQLDLRLYEEIDEAERQPRPNHPAALSLRYPNEETTGDQFVRSLLKDFLLYDNAYALLLPASGGQFSANWVPAHMMEIRGSSLFRAEGYRVHRRDGTWVDFAPEQILHWRGENPDDPRMGVSRLDTLRGVIAEDAALQQATIELANSGLQEPIWAARPLDAPPWSNEARKGFEEDLTNRLKRRNRVPVVMEEGMELKGFGVSPRDAQMFEVRRWAIERVATIYGLRPGVVGLGENIEDDRAHFYTDVLPPYCEEFTRMLNQRILVRVYGWTDGCFEFNLDEKHMGDDRLKALTSATGRPVMLTNEARAKINLPPVEGGDELVTPSNVVVGEKPSVDVMPIQDPNGPEQDGSYREEPKALNGGDPKALVKAEEPLTRLHPTRKAEHDRQLRHIDAFHGIVARHFTRLERSLRNKAGQADWRRWDREFSDDVHKTLQTIVEHEGELYTFKLAGTEFDMRRVRNYLLAMAEAAAEAINGKVREEIDDDGLEAAIGRFPQHIESSSAGLGAGATRFAREEAAKQAPGYENRVKVWVPNTKRHAEFGGQTVPIGDRWPAGFAPGTAPGCKCSMSIS